LLGGKLFHWHGKNRSQNAGNWGSMAY